MFQGLIMAWNFDGLSILKFGLTAIVWLIVVITGIKFSKNFFKITSEWGYISSSIFYTLITIHIFSIIRSFFYTEVSLFSLIGNIYNLPVLFLPGFVIYSKNEIFFKYIMRFYRWSIMFLCIVLVVFCLAINSYYKISIANSLIAILTPLTFVGYFLFIYKFRSHLLLIFGLIILLYAAFVVDSRTMMLKVLLIMATALGLKIFSKAAIGRFIYGLLMVSIIVFINVSATDLLDISNYTQDDTRTFLYVEVFRDLMRSNSLLIGKGAGGGYISEYFREVSSNNGFRHTVEVGFLSYTLKTGLIASLLYIGLLIIAIYRCFFITKSKPSYALGFFLLHYSLIFFIENLWFVGFTNVVVWLAIGLALRKDKILEPMFDHNSVSND